MAKVEIYTSMLTPYCIQALNFLTHKNINCENLEVTSQSDLKKTMQGRAGRSTSVPQKKFKDNRIGGAMN